MHDELVDAWRTNQKANETLLDGLSKDAMEARYAPRTRTVAAQFAHVHNIRVSHVKNLAPEHLGELTPFARGAEPGKTELRRALRASSRAIAAIFASCDGASRIKGANLLGYLVAHEAHHRGLALVALRLSGTKLPKDVLYGIWNWSKTRGR